VRRVECNGHLYALVVTQEDFTPGINFVSAPSWPLQLGLLTHHGGHEIPPHMHIGGSRKPPASFQEFLYVVSGSMEVDVYDGQGNYLQTETLAAGEGLLQVEGGHGFRFPLAAKVLEVKQGPYEGKDADKQLIASRPFSSKP